jgi:hypothetical protein
MYIHPYTLHELKLLRAASEPSRPPRRRPRSSTGRRRVRGLLRERPELTVFTVDAHEVAGQLAHDGAR